MHYAAGHWGETSELLWQNVHFVINVGCEVMTCRWRWTVRFSSRIWWILGFGNHWGSWWALWAQRTAEYCGVLCVSCARQCCRCHAVHTKTVSVKTELSDDSTKNRGDRSFLAVGQIVIHRCHYSYSKEGIKDNRNLRKTSYERISG